MKTILITIALTLALGMSACYKVDDFNFEENGYVAYSWIKHDSVNYYVNPYGDIVPNDCDTVLVREIWINYYTDHYHCNVLSTNDKWTTWDEYNFEGIKQ